RSAMTWWSVATGLLIFCWSRRLWGDVGGIVSLALFGFSPTTLAHGPLVTSDVVAAFWLLAATGAYWRHLQTFSLGTLTVSAAATAIATVAKFSFVLLPCVFLALVIARIAQGGSWSLRLPGGISKPVPGGRPGVLAAYAGSTGIHLALSIG